ncbi:carboxypeptidase B-like [Daphnia pulex]|uniref:carboxypeptidase B-like n=1 Tax=Daphnia pulex TaxID=6669 RepID=UPI001EE05C71|nr:carboxypeptidase B-like [Daphnia pulex]XP_046452058.1 carboxypeptidase B-like [Daphnia pulex]
MRILFVAITLCSVLLIGQATPVEDHVSYSGVQVWTITISSPEERHGLSKMISHYGLEVWKEARSNNPKTDLLVPVQYQKELGLKLMEANINYVIKINDLQAVIDNENLHTKASSSNTRSAHNMDWTSYHRLGDIYGYMSYLNATYPGLVSLINIGSSYEKRPLYVLRISNSSCNATKPAIWIDGGIHAREWISPAVTSYIIQQLVEVQANAKLLLNVDWYIMPVMNPDGYEFTHVSNRMWRKTRSLSSLSSCRGVDPNRNFGYKWGGLGTSTNPCSDIYKGTKAFSEPETLLTSNFILGKAKQIKLYLTIHSYGQAALVPWGYDVAYPSDYADMLALAKSAASTFRKYKFSVGNSAALYYPAAGGSDDWAKSVGIKYSYTFELADSGTYGFLLPSSDILPVAQDFFPALDVFATKIATLKV